MRGTRESILLAMLMLGACAPLRGQTGPGDRAPLACADWQSVRSVPGQRWWAEQRWRFRSDQEAEQAYARLASATPSPWPDWFAAPGEAVPTRTLPPGTRFQMALGVGQPAEKPGRFGTFDRILSVAEVRANLAVRTAWKPAIDRVVTYEVTRPIAVRIGPIGPLVDDRTCALLPGRWSHFEVIDPAGLIDHLTIVEIRPIR